MSRFFSPPDGISTGLILVAAALMTVGVVMLASTGATLEHSFFETMSWRSAVFRQVGFVGVGLLLMLGFSRVGPELFRWRAGWLFQPSLLFLLLAVVLLAAVWVPGVGVESHGRWRWVAIGSLGFQPSEVAKLGLVAFLAAYLTRARRGAVCAKPDLTIAMLATGLICAMVGFEDFGTAALLGLVGGMMMLVRGCSLRTMAAWSVPAVGAFGYLLFSHSYRVQRLTSFLRIWEDPRGTGYHAIQSLAAIASGGWTGRGLGAGMAKYGYLPEGRTDFIFSIICEELGLFGGGVVVMLFVTFVLLGWLTMRGARSTDGGFAKLFAFGVTVMLGLQALMNIAVVTVVAPTKGIALPLVSSGGSGVLVFSVAIGMLAGVPRLRSIGADTGSLRGVGCAGVLPVMEGA